MTETKHAGLPVSGYRPQTADAIDAVNENKRLEEMVLRQLDFLANVEPTDRRWLTIGRTAIEQGFMAVNRAIFKPGRAKLPGDVT
jgi:hypothetical protein